MQVYDSSLLSEGSSNPSEASTGFQRILDVMVDPAVTMCAAAAEEKARLRPRWDSAVFVLNCLSYLEVRLFRWAPACPVDTHADDVERA